MPRLVRQWQRRIHLQLKTLGPRLLLPTPRALLWTTMMVSYVCTMMTTSTRTTCLPRRTSSLPRRWCAEQRTERLPSRAPPTWSRELAVMIMETSMPSETAAIRRRQLADRRRRLHEIATLSVIPSLGLRLITIVVSVARKANDVPRTHGAKAARATADTAATAHRDEMGLLLHHEMVDQTRPPPPVTRVGVRQRARHLSTAAVSASNPGIGFNSARPNTNTASGDLTATTVVAIWCILTGVCHLDHCRCLVHLQQQLLL